MTSPPLLKENDLVAILAPAGRFNQDLIPVAKAKLTHWGLRTIEGRYLREQHHVFAGTDAQRLTALQQCLDNPEIRAILCMRGGYGTIRIIEQLDFTAFEKSPKWLIGFSDITVLHAQLSNVLGVESLHAVMPVNFPKDNSENNATESLRKALFGEPLSYRWDTTPENRHGRAQGPVVGGNLSILYGLGGTALDLNTSGKILFIEDLNEHLYHLDRMMHGLRMRGALQELSGLVVGGMTDMKDDDPSFGRTASEIVQDVVSDYDYPVCFNFPAGHIEDNRALILGREATMVVDSECSLSFS